ncbi:MAG TPA: hypothetical protein VGJ30_19805 [Candidatus Angelobacter sp.]|jgi:hypothetical protein
MTRDEDNQYWAGQHVEVVDGNVSGVQLQMRPGIEISGRVEDAEDSKPDFQQIRINLRADGLSEDTASEAADVQKDGTFKFTGLSRTRHHFEVTGLPGGWYLRNAMFGNQTLWTLDSTSRMTPTTYWSSPSALAPHGSTAQCLMAIILCGARW